MSGIVERYGLDPGCAACRLALESHIDSPREDGDRAEAFKLKTDWAKLQLNTNGGQKHRAFGAKERKSRKH